MEFSHSAKRKALLHMAAISVIYFLTESFRYTIFRLAFQICAPGIPALLLQLLLDFLNIGAVVFLYARYIVQKPFSEIYLGKPFFVFRWGFAAVMLPAAINVFYLVFADGTLQSGELPPEQQLLILFQELLAYGLRPAVTDGMLFRGLALSVLLKGFGKKGGVSSSAFLYAAVSLVSNAALFWLPGRAFLLFSASFLIGLALALVTCETGSVWPSVMIDALYHAFSGNGQILHIGTEQVYPSIYAYTLKSDSWMLAGLSGAFALETALPAMAGFSVIIVLAAVLAKLVQRCGNSSVLVQRCGNSSVLVQRCGNNGVLDNEPGKAQAAEARRKALRPAYLFLTGSLTGKMLKDLLNGLAAGTYLILLLYFGSKNMLQDYFLTHGTRESALVRELEAYAGQQHIAATDAEPLLSWAEENGIRDFKIFREGWLLFDAAYPGELLPGIRKMTGSSWRPFYAVSFADGNADVYVSTGFDEVYYQLLLAVSAASGFAACLWILISGMRENVAYIQCLEREVDAIRQGNLREAVTVKGQDELGRLACGLDQMRRQLFRKEQTEQELRAAQEKLVLGMAHDLRTPLTGLLAYMEVLKKQAAAGIPGQEYMDKAYDKILELRRLSDQMFEYFFIDSSQGVELEPPEEVRSVFEDYLSELCAMLDCSGFCVNAGIPEWRHVQVQVHTGYLGRIMNNIFSNLEKYGDKEKEIQLQILYEPDRVGISIQNRAAVPDHGVEGSGIGVKNICSMMEQMGGTAQAGMTDQDYRIVLYFPLYR